MTTKGKQWHIQPIDIEHFLKSFYALEPFTDSALTEQKLFRFEKEKQGDGN